MSEKRSLADTSGDLGSVSLHSGEDWMNWLQHADGTQPPRRLPPSPGQPEKAWAALVHLARREGFTVERGNCAAADGFTAWRNRRIRIRPDTAPGQAVTALAHQLGHVLRHSQIARLEPSGTVPCTGIRKVEADSIAWLVAAHLSIDTAITFPRVSSWAGTDPRARPAATIQIVTGRILAAAAAITAHLDAAGATGKQPAATTRTAGAAVAGQRAGPLVPAGEHARVHDSAALFFRSKMPDSWVPGYLASRGLSPAVQENWQAGHAPATWDALTGHLRAAGYPDTVIEAAGLARRSRRGTLIDTFRNRAMLPIRSAEGTVIAFIGRAADHVGPGVPKYLNSPSTGLYNKSEVLFGLWEARGALASGARPALVEGPFDAIGITTASHGRYAGVALCGTNLTARHVATLDHTADLRTAGVLVAFDPDEAGQRAAVHAYRLLVPLTERMAALTLPAGQDPAQILADSGPAALAEMLASHTRPLPDLVVDAETKRWSRRLRDPEGQIGALRATAPLIAAMPPAHIARQVARLAAIVQLDHATVTEAVTDALTALVADSDTTVHLARLRGRLPAVIRAAGQDSLQSAQQAIGLVAATTPPLAQARPASADHPRLPARRIPG